MNALAVPAVARVELEGMTCGGCVKSVTRVLTGVAGGA
ncbi:MAG TPA: cation transporter [Burkholderiales bacterium]|nr:cation transporter [Burkholderiales bacterium]